MRKSSEVALVKLSPDLLNCINEELSVGAIHGFQLPLHESKAVFNGIHVWAVSSPDNFSNPTVLQRSLADLGSVTRSLNEKKIKEC